METIELLEQLKREKVSDPEKKTIILERYLSLLVEGNERMNLTAIREPSQIRDKHFADSLSLLPYLEEAESLIDVGTGAGIPGIVVKILCPRLRVSLVEATEKKCAFLEETIEELELEGIAVYNARAEDIAHKGLRADVVTARAVAPMRILAELCVPLLRKNGVFVAMKGPGGLEEAEEADHAFQTLGAQLEDTRTYVLESGEQRMNLAYRKVKKTDPKYPRRYAEIKKNPL